MFRHDFGYQLLYGVANDKINQLLKSNLFSNFTQAPNSLTQSKYSKVLPLTSTNCSRHKRAFMSYVGLPGPFWPFLACAAKVGGVGSGGMVAKWRGRQLA